MINSYYPPDPPMQIHYEEHTIISREGDVYVVSYSEDDYGGKFWHWEQLSDGCEPKQRVYDYGEPPEYDPDIPF